MVEKEASCKRFNTSKKPILRSTGKSEGKKTLI
jgi:hypothetical protein